MWVDFQSRIYGFDGLFPRTIKDLTIHSGSASREYIMGNRVKYYGPAGYFFLMVTLFLLVLSILNINFYEFSAASNPFINQSGGQEVNKLIIDFVSDNLKILSFLIIPFQALWAKALFRKSGYNLLEHTVLPLFTQGHFLWVGIVNLFIYKYLHYTIMQSYLLVIMVLYYCYAVSDFYDYQNKIKSFLKGLLVFFLAYISYTVMIIILVSIYIFSNQDVLIKIAKPK